jgi:hypothetical protein
MPQVAQAQLPQTWPSASAPTGTGQSMVGPQGGGNFMDKMLGFFNKKPKKDRYTSNVAAVRG